MVVPEMIYRSSGGGGHNDDRGHSSDKDENDENGRGKNSINHNNNNNLGLNNITRKKDSNDQEKLQNSMEKVEQLKTDNLCANEKILMLKEQLAK